MKHNILLVDDNEALRNSMSAFLTDEGFFVRAVATGEEAIALVRQKFIPFSMAFIDFHMPGMKGPEVIRQIKEHNSNLLVFGLSGDDSDDAHNQSLDSGAAFFISKDTTDAKLLGILHRNCRDIEKKTRPLEICKSSENIKLIESVGMAGASNSLAEVARLILKFAPSKESVLIRGENGTGKEKIARAIHQNSPRRLMPFIAVNCAAIPESLIESELFGHEKGSFTGAGKDRVGYFKAA
ncbi:MAG TPA: sigma 54-interacting transcriptional regulator, partial [Pseudobdellovibrionaceae bacterium]